MGQPARVGAAGRPAGPDAGTVMRNYRDCHREGRDVENGLASVRALRRILNLAWDGEAPSDAQIKKIVADCGLSGSWASETASSGADMHGGVMAGNGADLLSLLDEYESKLRLQAEYLEWVSAYNMREYKRLTRRDRKRVMAAGTRTARGRGPAFHSILRDAIHSLA